MEESRRVPMDLSGNTAIVIGASSGIGAGIARELAGAGANVLSNYVGKRQGADLVLRQIAEYGGESFSFRADVSREGDVKAMFEAVIEKWGTVYILLNNAGIQDDSSFVDMSLKQWNNVLSVKLTGAFLCTREVAREFVRRGPVQRSQALGKIIFISEEDSMEGEFKLRLKRRERLLGTSLTIPSSEVAEMLSQAGFEWLWLDMEHAPFHLAQTQSMLQAIRPGCAGVVRSPWNDSVWIKRILDLGCDALIVPQIKTAAEAKAAVRSCKYPPKGIRSVAVARANQYGLTFEDYMNRANDEIAVILQVEHEDGLKNINEIAAVEGIDAIMVGPYDLSASLGLIGQVEHPRVKQAIHQIKSESLKHGVAAAIVADRPQLVSSYMNDGFSMVALGVDCLYLWTAAKQAVDETWKIQEKTKGQ